VIIQQSSEHRQHSNVARPERRGVSNTSVISKVHAEISCIDFADGCAAERGLSGLSGCWERVGEEWRRLCIIPDHHEKTPSFRVNPGKDVWYCDGCARGGDVIELARLVWGYSKHEVGIVAGLLLETFGHKPPPRPASWHRKQSRQERARREIEAAKTRRVQRRIYRWILAPALVNISDEVERLEEAEHAWEDAGKVARLLVLQLRGGAA
jgi:hypothetical protein